MANASRRVHGGVCWQLVNAQVTTLVAPIVTEGERACDAPAARGCPPGEFCACCKVPHGTAALTVLYLG